MRIFLVLLAVITLNDFDGYAAQVRPVSPARASDHVVVQRRKIMLVRSRTLAKQFPGRRTATVIYPLVSGLSNAAVLGRVRSILDFKNIFDYSLKEYREDAWLSEFSYVVNYNKNYLLDITFTQSGMAAYPDEQSKHFLINLRDGKVIKALDAFASDQLKQLAGMIDRKLQNEIREIEEETANYPDHQATEWSKEAYENLKFEMQNLNDFSVGRKGVTFLYDAGFPHAIKAFEPRGHYFFNYAELKPYIKRDGPLGQFVD